MISVQHLSKHYGQLRAVNDISFEVADQENLVLLGTSGCGKTTTLKMLNRLIEPTSGQIFIAGRNILDQSAEALRRSIGYVLQNTGLFPHYTVAENIAVVPKLLKWDKKRMMERTLELMGKLHLPEDCLHSFPAQLSGGQQQRVGLARALIADPPVLLMDEPFGALDNITRSKIQSEFNELDELKRKTIVMVTHDVQEAFELGHRICLMDKGAIIQIGTPEELLNTPANDFVRQFFNSQRLQLEFKAVSLKQLWPLLQTSGSPDHVTVAAPISVWAAMETMRAQQVTAIAVTEKDEKKVVTFEQLTSAFNQYQNSRVHE